MSSNFIRGQMDECPDNDGDEPVAKKSTNMSMLSFLTGAPKASQTQRENTSNHLAKKTGLLEGQACLHVVCK